MYKELDPAMVEVIAIDVRDMKEPMSELVQELGLTFPVLLDEKGIADKAYEIVYTPTTLIIDPEGRVIFRHVGFAGGQENMFDKEVRLLLQRR
jgi:peroxiredoxin